jgi:tripartite-type tricarboxylate transporter receptor subunit TctC
MTLQDARRGRLDRLARMIAVPLLGALCVAPATGGAQAYPSKPIRWIVAFSPGGGADNLARAVQAPLSDVMGQTVVIDNRGGGGGTIGTEMVARAAPDGYTMVLIATGHTVNATLLPKLPYDPVNDFTPVSLLASQSNILVVHPSVPVKTVKELIAYARAKPKAISFASGGNGSSPHLSGEMLKLAGRFEAVHIPYKGSGPAIADLLGGHVQLMFVGPLSIEGHVKTGRLRALAIADGKRMAILPDVPTMAEAGYPGIETGTWYAVLGPAGLPANVLERLHASFIRTLGLPDVRTRLGQQGIDIVGSSPAELDRFLRAEIAKWGKVVREAKIRVD